MILSSMLNGDKNRQCSICYSTSYFTVWDIIQLDLTHWWCKCCGYIFFLYQIQYLIVAVRPLSVMWVYWPQIFFDWLVEPKRPAIVMHCKYFSVIANFNSTYSNCEAWVCKTSLYIYYPMSQQEIYIAGVKCPLQI